MLDKIGTKPVSILKKRHRGRIAHPLRLSVSPAANLAKFCIGGYLARKKNKMAKKLYVGNLSYSVTDSVLSDHFAKAGTVASATVITDKMTGRSKGFGFVEMTNDDEAAKAIEMWDGKDMDGRTIRVSEARPMEPRAPRAGGGGGRFEKRNSW
jgi:RNA recognition motif-containing protein